jgi:predicted alpha/beta-fold hydrolase
VAVPTLLIHALDDPFMTKQVVPEKEDLSPFVQTELCKHGGHVGFVSGKNPFKPIYWLETRIADFLLSRWGEYNNTHPKS